MASGDDERLALSNRFLQEGLDVTVLTDGQKLPHCWRWLVDAETNCQSLRRQIDKLHRQHEQDLKEVEEYLEHVWKLSNDRLQQLDTENKSLKKQILAYKTNNNNNNNKIIDNNDNNKGQSYLSNGSLSSSSSPSSMMAPVVKQNNNNIDNLCDSLKLKSNTTTINNNNNNSKTSSKLIIQK
ncbi:ABC transporter H family member 2-like [Oppia nitens]|uniref:ABC transporter H family member 2-like n=1 Tax=Oppia nitens TaxID=1686743 RepID=UPI0023D99576|nr:ABC transporter H family member 2-like [Oppia nitens]